MPEVTDIDFTETIVLDDMGNTTKDKPETRQLWQKILLDTLGPLFLIIVTPNITVCVLYIVVHHGSRGSVILEKGFGQLWLESWSEACAWDGYTWLLVTLFALWGAASVLVPCGSIYQGPPTENGFKPTYRNNGLYYYVTTLVLTAMLANPAIVPAFHWYKCFSQLAGTLNVLGLIVCTFFLIKGTFFPSPGEHGSSKNFIFDFYWGLELYPRLGKWFDLKMWTNCRFGMMAWQLIVILSWRAQFEHSGWSWAMATTALLQTIYIAKFYVWENGYMTSIDIIVDRAGFYICWGCIFFVPTFYTLTSVYMVENASSSSPLLFVLIFLFGVSMIGCNYWADYQRQLCTELNGKCTIWRRPAKVIRASYTDKKGQTKERVLLASGFWGLSRHMNYIFEVLAAFSWAVPSLFYSVIPYSYVLFLIVLLVHRSFRDEKKCREKYGSYWTEYCKISKYQLIPYVF